MYADTHLTRGARSASLGAALLINGGILAGMLFFLEPDAVRRLIPPDTKLVEFNDPLPPPPQTPPKPEHEVKVQPRETIVAHKPLVDVHAKPSEFVTTEKVTEPTLNPPGTGTEPGTVTPPVESKPVPPPLIRATPDPRYAGDFQPAYPAAEVRLDREGAVTVRVLVGTDGRVKDVQRVSATSDAFFDATRRQALSRWRFRPATRGGVAEESWWTMTVRFQLQNQ